MSDERTLEEQCYGECWAAKERIAELNASLAEASLTNATLRAEVARANAERDEAREQLRLANIDQFNSEAEVAALKANDPLAEMWRELAEYQPIADRDGHGESWKRMCEERTEEAASAAYGARQASSHVADAAYGACWAAQRDAAVRLLSKYAAARAADALAAIRRAKEVQP